MCNRVIGLEERPCVVGLEYIIMDGSDGRVSITASLHACLVYQFLIYKIISHTSEDGKSAHHK